MTIKGSCLCGDVTFEIRAEFKNFYLCHCAHCQKDTGSAYAANLFTGKEALVWLTGEDKVKMFKLTPTRHSKSFCCQCGSAVPNTANGFCSVPAGSLDSQISRTPDAHIFTASQADWESGLEALKSYARFPE